ncbi:helix-turn-helix domain-containing protein [Piscinibacter sp. XHJ-5]|uniref:helix-turn-helix domain-containing protein n=1 Tax=Piscinibacter sp. XHJ-5 TaxID=3037797 RepID=UPI0024532805|nr:helix-turn-helix domain-containing protein [Piscinibacter sp. XHJ-5]
MPSQRFIVQPSRRLARHVLCFVARDGGAGAAPPDDADGAQFPAHVYGSIVATLRGAIMDGATGRSLPPLTVSGAQTSPCTRRYREDTLSIVAILKPGCAARLCGVPAARLTDAHADAFEVMETPPAGWIEHIARGRGLLERIARFDALLLSRLAVAAEPGAGLQELLWPLLPALPRMSVGDVARHFRLSERSVQRRFVAEFGLAPKVFLRLVRIQHALRLLQQRCAAPLADLALACGFSDQAHLTRELRVLAGFTPTALQEPGSDHRLRSWVLQAPHSLLALS